MRFIRFGSRRARHYGLEAIKRRPKSYYSWQRTTYPGGVYAVTDEEIAQMRSYSSHARFTVLRKPYGDLMECILWSKWPEEEPEPALDRPLRLDADRIEYEERREALEP